MKLYCPEKEHFVFVKKAYRETWRYGALRRRYAFAKHCCIRVVLLNLQNKSLVDKYIEHKHESMFFKSRVILSVFFSFVVFHETKYVTSRTTTSRMQHHLLWTSSSFFIFPFQMTIYHDKNDCNYILLFKNYSWKTCVSRLSTQHKKIAFLSRSGVNPSVFSQT